MLNQAQVNLQVEAERRAAAAREAASSSEAFWHGMSRGLIDLLAKAERQIAELEREAKT
jgi:hypothetical protein